jgi:hypothetical protein
MMYPDQSEPAHNECQLQTLCVRVPLLQSVEYIVVDQHDDYTNTMVWDKDTETSTTKTLLHSSGDHFIVLSAFVGAGHDRTLPIRQPSQTKQILQAAEGDGDVTRILSSEETKYRKMIVVDQNKSMLPIEASVFVGEWCALVRFNMCLLLEVGDVPFAKGVDTTYDDCIIHWAEEEKHTSVGSVCQTNYTSLPMTIFFFGTDATRWVWGRCPQDVGRGLDSGTAQESLFILQRKSVFLVEGGGGGYLIKKGSDY